MNRSELLSLYEKLSCVKNALLVGHSHPDGDCVGTAVSLACLIEALGGKASLAFPESVPQRLAFILGDREAMVTIPMCDEPCDIICVDLASPVQMASLREQIEGRAYLRIDHHDVGVPYASFEYVDKNAAATGEILFDLWELALESGVIGEMPSEALCATFAAISSDTGCFKYANVTPKTHLRAAKMLEYGVNSAEINRLLFDTKDKKQLKAEGIANIKLESFCDGTVSGIAIEKEDYADALSISDFETAIDIARSVRGTVFAVVAKASSESGAFRVSLRSNSDADVSAVAAHFGGGGHIRAAGCTIHADSAREALLLVVAELEKAIVK